MSRPIGGTFAPSAAADNITFTPTAAQEAAGGLTLRLTSNDPGTSCGPTSAEIQIIIGLNPIADAGPDIEDCEPADGLLHLSQLPELELRPITPTTGLSHSLTC